MDNVTQTHDPITGLPDRRRMRAQLARAIERAQAEPGNLTVLLVDVDAFRIVNAAAGQDAGDMLLAAIAWRLVCAAAGSFVARSGDNEFTILADVEPAGLRHAFDEPFDLGGREIYVTASVGVAELARDGDDADLLLRAAGAALRRAKELGGNQRQDSSSALTAAEFERLHVEERVRRAIQKSELSLVYQPQIRLSDGKLLGLEALLRWNRNGQIVPASAFIRAIEHSAVIVDLGQWVVSETCRQIAEWREAGVTVPRIAVNIGARHFQQSRFVSTIGALLALHGVEGSALELEITETTAMHDAAATVRTVDALRALGIAITIDDFGTGYSSLAYLKRFAITGLKIDRTFVSDVPSSRSATAIVNAIVATAHALDLRVIAEGVETREQADFLTESHCDEAQGYLFARPIASKDIPDYLQNRKENNHHAA